MKRLEAFIAACEAWHEDETQFSTLLADGADIVGLSNKDVAAEFEVAESTISRWARSLSRPHTRIQGLVVRFLHRRASRLLKSLTAPAVEVGRPRRPNFASAPPVVATDAVALTKAG